MQILVQIVCTKGPSLRARIANHPKLRDQSGLEVTRHFKRKAAVQYTLLNLPGSHGSVRMWWDSPTRSLLARVVTQEGGNPGPILRAFVGFVLEYFHRRLKSVSIIPLD